MLIVCPFNRPEKIARVLEQWKRQRGECELVLVANEAGAWCEQAAAAGANFITYPSSIGQAKNLGVSFARSGGHDHVVFWDDDNYYGPSYVLEMRQHLERSDVVSLGIAFVRFDDGLYLFETNLGFCPGHSTAVRTSICPEFPDLSLSEDVVWSKRLPGGTWTYHADPWFSVYDRRGAGHAYGAGKAEFLRSFGPARRIGNVGDEFVDSPSDVSSFEYEQANDEEIFAMMESILISNGFR